MHLPPLDDSIWQNNGIIKIYFISIHLEIQTVGFGFKKLSIKRVACMIHNNILKCFFKQFSVKWLVISASETLEKNVKIGKKFKDRKMPTSPLFLIQKRFERCVSSKHLLKGSDRQWMVVELRLQYCRELFLGFIWDIFKVLKICNYWVWAQSWRLKSSLQVSSTFRESVFFLNY